MRDKFTGLIVLVALFAAFAAFGQTPAKPDKKIEVQLLWGTDQPKSPNPAHRAVEADIQRRLKNSPYKWSHYFLVTNQTVFVPRGSATNVAISQKCSLEVKDLGKTMLELSFFGQGKKVEKRTQS